MLDPKDPEACGRCHDGTLSRPSGVTFAAPGATACTTCHTEPEGVLACSTCHGEGAKSYPPRDQCFFPGDSTRPDAHAAHVESSAARAGGLACSACHPIPGANVIAGLHGNGSVDIVFDAALVAPEATYDAGAGACAVACHDRGGARPEPLWSDPKPMGCGDCHASPPANHFVGPCTSCHREANAAGTALSGGPLHMNGRVDLGDGSGQCGACHGSGSDPWPTTGAHGAHKNPLLTTAIDCASCHVVPSVVLAAGHLDGIVQVLFSGRALDRGAVPAWNGTSCTSVACHGANLVDPPLVVPTWADTSGAASACGACHGLPPTQHTPQTSCESAICHGSEVLRTISNVLSITPMGRSLHIDGVIEPP
jgi:predicted CxxxxCH...CXXCH cytochrome family protein